MFFVYSYKDSVYKSGSGAGGSDSSRRISELMDKVDRIDSKLDKLDNQMKKTSDLVSIYAFQQTEYFYLIF